MKPEQAHYLDVCGVLPADVSFVCLKRKKIPPAFMDTTITDLHPDIQFTIHVQLYKATIICITL